MFKNIKELKAFILWAKSEKVKSVTLDNVSFEISDIAFVDEVVANQTDSRALSEVTDFEKKTLVDTEEPDQKEEDELLFWSTNK